MRQRLTLILGGMRSGKSCYAQQLASGGERVLFVATAEAGDREMEARIRAHRDSRPADCNTLEEPVELVEALGPVLRSYDTVLLDCLTLWVSNALLRERDAESARRVIISRAKKLLELILDSDCSWIVVSNEVGLGLVPATELGRVYADELGRVNQAVAADADEVYFMAAGLPIRLKAATE